MRALILAATLGVASLAFLSPSKASAHEPYGLRGYYGSRYHGAWHTMRPHWHRTYTPFGVYSWYGVDRHDFHYHRHYPAPWGTRTFSRSPLGVTEHLHRYPWRYGW